MWGLSKRAANIDLWVKDLAPTVSLRQWFHVDPAGRWQEFARCYRGELRRHKAAVKTFRTQVARRKRVTLLFAGADPAHTHTRVLLKFLSKGKA